MDNADSDCSGDDSDSDDHQEEVMVPLAEEAQPLSSGSASNEAEAEQNECGTHCPRMHVCIPRDIYIYTILQHTMGHKAFSQIATISM